MSSEAGLGEDDAGDHVAEREQHGEAKAVASQQVLVEQQNAYVGRKPALTPLLIGIEQDGVP